MRHPGHYFKYIICISSVICNQFGIYNGRQTAICTKSEQNLGFIEKQEVKLSFPTSCLLITYLLLLKEQVQDRILGDLAEVVTDSDIFQGVLNSSFVIANPD